MAQDFTNYLISVILVSLFVFAMISFGVQIANDNGSESTILQDPTINKTFSSLETNLSEQQQIAQESRELFEQEDPLKTLVFLFSSMIGTVKRTTNSMALFVNILFSLFTEILGVGSGTGAIILGTFSAIVILLFLFLGWDKFRK